jgi:hypothetical protein
MPLIPAALACFAGWSVYALMRKREARLDPAGVATIYLLGAGVIYVVHNGFMLLFRLNPPPLMLVIWAAFGLALIVRDKQSVLRRADWQQFVRERWWSLLLAAVIVAALIGSAINGYGNDGWRIWVGRALAYHNQPDYWLHLTIPYHTHPVYPPLFIHQIQWQLAFTDTLFGIKLPTPLFYTALLLIVFSLLRDKVRHPVMWTFFAATLPPLLNWSTMALADIALAAYVAASMYWLMRGVGLAALLLALAAVTKQEGLLVCLCVVITTLWIARRQPDLRPLLARFVIVALLLIGLLSVSWYGLVIGARVPDASDFDLSKPQPAQYVAALPMIPLTTLYPSGYHFHGVWYLFGVIVIGQLRKRTLRSDNVYFWLMPLLYAALILIAYLFSRSSNISDHMDNSYSRVLIHMTPLVLVYTAWALDEKPASLNSFVKD